MDIREFEEIQKSINAAHGLDPEEPVFEAVLVAGTESGTDKRVVEKFRFSEDLTMMVWMDQVLDLQRRRLTYPEKKLDWLNRFKYFNERWGAERVPLVLKSIRRAMEREGDEIMAEEPLA